MPAKHIFLDVVGFTRARSVEAQTDIVGYLNSLVSGCLEQHDSQKTSVSYFLQAMDFV